MTEGTASDITVSAQDKPTFTRWLNILRAGTEAFFVRHRDRLAWVHLIMFVAFVAMIAGPLFLLDPPEDATPLTHFTTLTNFLIWGLWFPLVFLSVIFTGRSWCGVLCPMGAASEMANDYGLKRPIPNWMKWEGTPIVSFLFITVLGQTVGVRDHPEAIAEVFGGTMLAAILIGYVYGQGRTKRPWCRHMCPIGLLLGVFSRLGAVQFAVKQPKPGDDRYQARGPCPTLIDIPRKKESRHCIQCFRCVNPKSEGGLKLRFRRPGAEVENIRDHSPHGAEVWFFFLGTGAALGGFLWLILPEYMQIRQWFANWTLGNEWYWIGNPGPSWLMSVHPERREIFRWIDFFMIVGFMLGFMVAFAAVLTTTTSLSSWLAGRLGGDRNFKQRFIELGYQYAPVAMMSLIIGLGSELFEGLRLLGLESQLIGVAKGFLFFCALLWSLRLGRKILIRQGTRNIWPPFLVGAIGSLFVGAAWWLAIFVT